MSDELVNWLRDQIDIDQRLALAADRGPWEVGPSFGARDTRVYVREEGAFDWVGQVFAAQVSNKDNCRENAQFIANFDPSRVLREVEAKRKILARHEPIEVFGQLLCTYCGVVKGASRPDASWPCPDLRDLAAIFKDSPGYQEAWRPA